MKMTSDFRFQPRLLDEEPALGSDLIKGIGLLCLVLCVVVSASATFAASEIKVLEVTGRGLTAQEATIDGLLQGIQQVSGMEVSALQQIRSAFSVESDGDSEHALSSEFQASDILQKTQGYVKAYDVLGSRQIEEHRWEVDLAVSIPVYKTLGTGKARAAHMRSMAVLPFRSTEAFYRLGSAREPASEIVRELSQKITNQLVQSRRFRLVEREYVEEVFGEKRFLQSADVPFEELTRIGQSLGADYLLVGTVSSVYIEDVTETFGNFSKQSTFGGYTVDYRVIETAPQEIRWADTASDSFDASNAGANSPYAREELFNGAALQIADGILAVIYPLKVLDVAENGSVLLTQGGARVENGTQYRVHGPSRRIIDPDTRVPTKVMGAAVATVEVTAVFPKYSEAQIIQGDLASVKVGSTVMAVPGRDAGVQAEPEIREVPAASGEAPVNW